jgi:signal transduction histidine kinase
MSTSPVPILLVDHDEKDFNAARALLEQFETDTYCLDWAPDFEAGLRALSKGAYALVLVEYHLGGKTGLDFLQALKDRGPEAPVIVLTEKGDREVDLQVMREGAYDFLIKGEYDASLLERSLRYALSRRKTEEHLLHTARELERMNSTLKETQSRIIQQEKMASIGQLAAGVAHEINNPIGFVSSNLRTLAKYADSVTGFFKELQRLLADAPAGSPLHALKDQWRDRQLDYAVEDMIDLIQESLEGTDRVVKIVKDLKNFSRVDEAEHQHANINDCLDSTINIVWNELKYKAQLTKEYGALPRIKCFPRLLNQVFMNLLVNASHAIEKQGVITVKTWQDNGSIVASVSDTGCGIPEPIRKKIFEPFFTTKEAGKGTGLGLSIAYDIVARHKGEITVDSEVGRGTTFTVRVPALEPQS